MRKQLLNLKFLLMLCMIFGIGGSSVAFAEEETIDFSNGSYSVNQIVWSGTSCTITQAQGSSTTKPSSSYISAPRWYASHVISFSAKENYTISSVTVVATTPAYATALGNSTYSNGASAEVSSSTVTITANGDFTITMSAQSRISSVTVTYTKGTSTTPSISVLKKSLSFDQVETGSNKKMTFTLTGENLTEPASLTIDGTGKDMFSVIPSSVSPTDGTISETTITVTYAPTTAGDHVAALNITSGEATATVDLSGTGIAPLTHYTVSWKVNGADYTTGNPSTKVAEGKKVTTLPTAPEAINGKVFVGWTNAELATSQGEAPSVLFTTTESAPDVTGNTTYYAVFATQSGSAPADTLSQTLQYDTWICSGSTTDKSSYRLFHTDSYIESAEFDLSTLSKVVVYGGTFGGTSYNKLTIGDGTNTWKEVTVSGNSQTGVNTYTDGNALSGTGKLRITSKSGTASSTGVRISKVEIYTTTGGYTYSDYVTTIKVTGTLTLVAKDNGIYYATFSNNEPVLFTTDVEVDAVSVSGTTLKFSELTKGEYNVRTNVEGSSASVDSLYYVPANTGVLIQSVTDNVTYYYLYESQTVTLPENNLKAAPAAGETFDAEAGYRYYKLAYDNYATQTGLGFYLGAADGGAFSVKAGTAYLAVPTSETTNVKGFSFDGTTTGISAVGAEGTAKTNEIYNIAGQRVNAMNKAGLYIVNGKKMVIKK